MRRRLSRHRARSAEARDRLVMTRKMPASTMTPVATTAIVTSRRIGSVLYSVDNLAADDGHDDRRPGDVIPLGRVKNVPRKDDEVRQLARRERPAVVLLEAGVGARQRVGLD